ncbi:MAG: hypothetical protein K1X29_09310 [Bdellovibrionales bacterium]|nr:hypothetical protein [Bdellovibrionales bacterium]
MGPLIVKIFTLWALFSVEIHIQANERSQNESAQFKPKVFIKKMTADYWLTEPKDCDLAQEGSCIGLALTNKAVKVFPTAVLVAEKGTVIRWDDQMQMTVVQGTALVESEENQVVLFPFAKVEGQGRLLIFRQNQRVKIIVIQGSYQVLAKGRNQAFHLPRGFMMTLGEVSTEGFASVGVPQMESLNLVLKKWWNLFVGSKHDFSLLAKDYIQHHLDIIHEASLWQKDKAQRYIASENEKHNIALEHQRQRELQKAKMRALFRKMNYLEENE